MAIDKRIGNQFWKQRAKHGRDKLFETPELLLEAACEYFQWCDDNPLYEQKAFISKGVIKKSKVAKMRAYTLGGLCIFLDCNEAYFRSFKSQERIDKKDFSTVIKQIELIIYNQKFTGAAADLLNANIISRDLALKEVTETTIKEELDLSQLSEEELDQYQKLAEKSLRKN